MSSKNEVCHTGLSPFDCTAGVRKGLRRDDTGAADEMGGSRLATPVLEADELEDDGNNDVEGLGVEPNEAALVADPDPEPVDLVRLPAPDAASPEAVQPARESP